MSKLVLRCWKHGHIVEMNLPSGKIPKFIEQCNKLKRVCPDCSPENNHLVVISNEAETLFENKSYQCRHGHLTTVSTFGRAARRLSIRWGHGHEESENFEGGVEDLPEMIEQKGITCHHTKDNGKLCDCRLTACDDVTLSYPEFSNFKTKVRVEDIWRKYGAAEPKTGEVDKHGEYKPSVFEERNKARLKSMQRKRNISEDRLPGKPI